MKQALDIRPASIDDVPLILRFIKDLAQYEKLSHEVVASEDDLRQSLFGDTAYAHVVIGYLDNEPVSFALYFYNYSTFLAKPGLYLEDLYVEPSARGHGVGKKMLAYLAYVAKKKGCGRFEWWVLDWNESAIAFYKSLGAKPMDEWTVFRVDGEALDELSQTYRNEVG